MFELFSGKGKKGKFEIEITIHGLSGVPYLSGFYFAKWKTKGLRCISGSTTSASVKDHSVIWNHEFSDDIYLYLNRSNNVIPSPLKIEFRQQIAGTRRSEPVGKVEIELSEFIGSEKTPKQYLLDASRMNSMAIITISLSPSANDEISLYIASLCEREFRARKITTTGSNRQDSPLLTGAAKRFLATQNGNDLSLERASVSAKLPDKDAEFVDALFLSHQASLKK